MPAVESVWRKSARLSALFVFLAVTLTVATASAGPADDAAAYLLAQQRADGAIAGPNDIATVQQASAEALRALAADGAVRESGLNFLSSVSPEAQPTEYLARYLSVLNTTGAAHDALRRRQNTDGGFGAAASLPSSVLDTAYALQALAHIENSSSQDAGRAVSYLLAQQSDNGSWQDSIFTTATAMLALQSYGDSVFGVRAAQTAAASYLLGQREESGWAELHQRALAIAALGGTAIEPGIYAADVDALFATQSANGSWQDDVYLTALALRAHKAYEARQLGIDPGSESGAVAGRVLRAGTAEPVVGAHVYLASAPDVGVTTDSDGRFLLRSVSATSQTIIAESAGLTPASVMVDVVAGELVSAPALVLGVSADTAIVSASAMDGVSGQPVGGTQFMLEGPSSATLTAGDSGNVSFAAIEPGDYTLTVSASEYRTEHAVFTVAGGEVMQVRQLLLPEDAYNGSESVDLVLRVVDANTRTALAGAILNIDGRTATADADGVIHVQSLAPGSYNTTLSAAGYATAKLGFSLPAGANADLGDVALAALNGPAAPQTLDLEIRVTDSVNHAAIGGAQVQVVETGETLATDAQGIARIAGLTVTDVHLSVSAGGYLASNSTLTALAFGSYAVTVPLTPASGDPDRTSSALMGVVSDRASGEPIAGATVRLLNSSVETTTATDGSYRLEPVESLAFAVQAQAFGYETMQLAGEVSVHGDYTMDFALDAAFIPESGIRIAALETLGEPQPGQPIGTATIANTNLSERTVLLTAEALDAEGEPLGNVRLIDPDTGASVSELALSANASTNVGWAWYSGHAPAGSYQLVLRAVEPGSFSSSRPLGIALAERATRVTLASRRGIVGQFQSDPPVVQFGVENPVELSVLLVNDGNVLLEGEDFRLRLVDSTTGTERFRAEAVLASLSVGAYELVSFGSWLPQEAGDLDVIVEPLNDAIAGKVTGELYVGNKASGTLSVTPDAVLPGDQMVQAALALQGVDVRGGTSTDPLFFAVQEAVKKGSDYVAPNAKAWHERNQCLGCHVQTQSFFGLVNADEFKDIPAPETTFLYNAMASAQKRNGVIRTSSPSSPVTQSGLAGWALSETESDGPLYTTKYQLAQALHNFVRRDGNGNAYWGPDDLTGWWNSYEATTYLAVKSLVDTILQEDAPENRAALRQIDQVSTSVNGNYYNDIAMSPDGQYLYMASKNGYVNRMELTSGRIEPAPQYTGPIRYIQSVLPATSGSLYVSGSGFIEKYLPDGSRISLRNSSGFYADITTVPNGGIYVSDYDNNRILHLQDDGSTTVLSSGGLLNKPFGLELLADGSLVVANNRGRNILRVHPDGSQEIIADGLLKYPLQIAQYGDGFLFTEGNSPNGLNYLDTATGRVVHYSDFVNLTGVEVFDEEAWLVNYNNGRVYRFGSAILDAEELDTFHTDVMNALDWAMNRSNCVNSTDNIQVATCLMIHGEALRLVEDPVMTTAVEQRMDILGTILRDRQRVDGGWGGSADSLSNAVTTALVGMALEYTHPSADDPMVRRTIEYLLDTQRSDGAWTNSGGIFGGPPLAATSLVMAYMPKAMLRLGGIDVDVNLRFADNVQPGDPSLPANEITSDGATTVYRWSLSGVTSEGRGFEFPANLPAMQIGESRPLVREAWLEFHNTFNDDVVRVDIAIPEVRAVSGMAVSVATDKMEYNEQTPVTISGTVNNLTGIPESGVVELAVRAVGAETNLATLGVVAPGTVPANGSLTFQAAWNTGTTLPGELEVVATLINSSGTVADSAIAPFVIARPESAISASIATDRQVYGGFDSVQLTNRVVNITSNAPQREMRGVLSVTDANGAEIHARVLDIPGLMPNAHVDIPDSFVLQDAPAGEYHATLTVQDAISRATLATAQASFRVERSAGDAITGKTEVAEPHVYQGDANTCTDTLGNRGGAAVTATFIYQFVSLQDGTVLEETTRTVQLAPGSTDLNSRGIATGNLAIGGYACRLLADFGAGPIPLAAAAFGVLEPPIRIAALLNPGQRGRLLVLLDPACTDRNPPEVRGNACDADPYGPDFAVPLPIQREHLEAVLTNAGWTYTIATNAEDFQTAFASRGYELYALFNEQVKLPEALQRAVVADIAKGRGLLVAGNHDRRNGRLEDALGIKSLGKNLQIEALVTRPFGTHVGGPIAFDIAYQPTALRLEGADILGEFSLQPKGKKTPAPEPALTSNAHGEGSGLYAGFDWPAQSALQGDNGALAHLLTASLDVTHTAPYLPIAGRVFPLRVTLQNEGMATPGAVQLALPPGLAFIQGPAGATAVDGVVTWPFVLAEDQQLNFTLWLRLPMATGPLTLEAVIFSGPRNERKEHVRTQTVLHVLPEE